MEHPTKRDGTLIEVKRASLNRRLLQDYPLEISQYLRNSYWKWPIEILDSPIKKEADFPNLPGLARELARKLVRAGTDPAHPGLPEISLLHRGSGQQVPWMSSCPRISSPRFSYRGEIPQMDGLFHIGNPSINGWFVYHFIPICSPWCWYIYPNGVIFG